MGCSTILPCRETRAQGAEYVHGSPREVVCSPQGPSDQVDPVCVRSDALQPQVASERSGNVFVRSLSHDENSCPANPREAEDLVKTLSEHSQPVRVSSRSHFLGEVDEALDCPIAAVDSKNSDESVTLSATGSIHASERTVVSRRLSRVVASVALEIMRKVRKYEKTGKTANMGLEQRLQFFGMRSLHMKADGNCQFRSLAFCLFGSQHYHPVVRKAVVTHMAKHADFFAEYFRSENRFKRYLVEMARCYTWGDELTLRAVVEVYVCVLHVITSSPTHWHLAYEPENKSKHPDLSIAQCPKGVALPPVGKLVFLAYEAPVHYNAIIARGSKSDGEDMINASLKGDGE